MNNQIICQKKLKIKVRRNSVIIFLFRANNLNNNFFPLSHCTFCGEPTEFFILVNIKIYVMLCCTLMYVQVMCSTLALCFLQTKTRRSKARRQKRVDIQIPLYKKLLFINENKQHIFNNYLELNASKRVFIILKQSFCRRM